MTSNFLKKFLGPAEIEVAIGEISRLAKLNGFDVALAGGVALQLYGSDRLTKDIDFLASDEPDTGFKQTKRLSFGGVAGVTSLGTPVDLIVRDDGVKKLYQAALDDALFFGELGIKVVSVEFMATIKFDAGRLKDQQDLETLLFLGELNLKRTRDIVREFLGDFALKEFNSVVYEVEWRKSKEDTEGR